MKSLPTYLLNCFNTIGEQLEQSNPLIVAHFYIPNTDWHYFAFDYDPDVRLFNGYITGIINDYSIFSLLELSGEYHAWGTALLDESWQAIPFRSIKNRLP